MTTTNTTTPTTEEIYTKTEKEYMEIDKNTNKARKYFETLKTMEALGQYGTELWKETFTKYAEVYKKAHGYRPHWAR